MDEIVTPLPQTKWQTNQVLVMIVPLVNGHILSIAVTRNCKLRAQRRPVLEFARCQEQINRLKNLVVGKLEVQTRSYAFQIWEIGEVKKCGWNGISHERGFSWRLNPHRPAIYLSEYGFQVPTTNYMFFCPSFKVVIHDPWRQHETYPIIRNGSRNYHKRWF